MPDVYGERAATTMAINGGTSVDDDAKQDDDSQDVDYG